MSKRGLKFIVFVQCLLFLSPTNLFKYNTTVVQRLVGTERLAMAKIFRSNKNLNRPTDPVFFHLFALSLHLAQSVSQIMLLLSGTFFLNLFVRAHLIPQSHFLDFILKSRNILALALYQYQHLKPS